MLNQSNHHLMGTLPGWWQFFKILSGWLLVAFVVGSLFAGYFLIDWDGVETCTPEAPLYIGPEVGTENVNG